MDTIQSGWNSFQAHIGEYLDMSEKRNIIASLAAGVLFFTGWWIIIDVAARYETNSAESQFHGAFHIFGVFGTISFIIVNSISNSQLRGDGYPEDSKAAKVWLLIGFILGFSALTGSIWVLISEYASGKYTAFYPGVALLFQNILIFLGSLVFKFGRIEE